MIKSNPARIMNLAFCLTVCLWAQGALSLAADLVLDWNNAALEAIRATKDNPPKATRAMAIEHIAIYDAANGIVRSYRPYFITEMAPSGASLEAAIASAGYHTLTALYSDSEVQENIFLALYNEHLGAIPEGQSKSDGIAWGEMVANSVLDLRADDGWDAEVPHQQIDEIGHWKPTPAMFTPALLPGWGSVTPFTMISGNQFRPQPPPPVNSSTYAFEVNVVKAYGSIDSEVRNADQTEIALFWNDNPGTETPPGHWNAIAGEISATRELSLMENVRLFALLNLTLADAAISCWEAKFHYYYWRPIDAIREADADGNPETIADPDWTALIFMPPFPDYTSGHSTFSRSAATILAGFFGTDEIEFTTTSRGVPGAERNYSSFSEAADEAGISRIYGGIHYPSANLHAQACGYRIANQVLDYYLQPLHQLRFSQVHHRSENTRLELQVEANRTYSLRASSDMKTWEHIATLSSSDGVIIFEDTNAKDNQLRFYQAEAQ